MACNEEKILSIDGMSREAARECIMSLSRGENFIVHVYEYPDGTKRRVFIKTVGRKSAKDIKIYYETKEGEVRGFSYIEDILVDLMIKKQGLPDIIIEKFIKAAQDSIELVSIYEIRKRYPELFTDKMWKLPGHPFELMLTLLKWAGVQEDINYWGINPKTNKPYEGRYKPLNALKDLFIENKRLIDVLKKHRLC